MHSRYELGRCAPGRNSRCAEVLIELKVCSAGSGITVRGFNKFGAMYVDAMYVDAMYVGVMYVGVMYVESLD
jgi:hypothetical protein